MKRFLKAGMWVFLGVMLSRVLGLVRDILMTRQFGTGELSDVIVYVVTVPDTMINLLVGGAMGAALIPEFKRRDGREGWGLFRQVSGAVFMFLVAVTGVLALLAEPMTRFLVRGLEGDVFELAVRLVRVSLWAIPLTAVSAVVRSKLHSGDRFAVPSLAGFFFNMAIVLGLVLASAEFLWPVAWAAVLGAGISFGMHQVDVMRLKPKEALGSLGKLIDKELVGRYFQALAAGSVILVLPLAMRTFGSLTGKGGLTSAYLAAKLVELPMGTLLSVVSVAMFPAVAAALAKEDGFDEGKRLAEQGIGVIMAMAVPVALGIAWFAVDWANLLYGRGKMEPEDVAVIGGMGMILMLGLVPAAVNTMLIAVYNSLRDMRTTFWLSLVAILSFVAVGVGLGTGISLSGIGWMVVGFHWFLLMGFVVLLQKKHGMSLWGGLLGKSALLRTGVTVVVFGGMALVFDGIVESSVVRVLGSIGIGVVAGIVGLLCDKGTLEKVKGVLRSKLRGKRT